jgi:hypothetical protein
MENPILDFTDTLAKYELLARLHLHNNHIHEFVVRSEDELRAHNAGAIEAARARGLAPVFNFEPGGYDGELVEPAPQPAAVRRQRKRSLAKVCEVARRAGANHVIVDGVVIAFPPATAAAVESNGNEFDEWMAKHAHQTEGH